MRRAFAATSLLAGIAYAAFAPQGCTSSSSAPTPTPTHQVSVAAAVSYSGGITGTHQLYYALHNSNSYNMPLSGWVAEGNQTSPFAATVSLTSTVINNGTNYALAYWSVSGSSTGPQGNDPKGSAAFNVNQGGGNVSVAITLQ